MKVFVLSICRFDTLELLEVFDTYDHAHECAIRFCDIAEIAPEYRLERRSEQMRGWVIAESPKYFISILERKVSLLAPVKPAAPLVSYNDISDLVSGKSPAILSDPITDPVVLVNMTLPPAPPAPTVSLDNPYDDNLPAGFHYSNGRPLVMDDIKNDPDGPIYIDSLSENQKWALVIARINKRPHFEIDVNGFYPFSFSQSETLKVLKAKNMVGQIIRDKELELLQVFYDKCVDEKKSSHDDFYYDESSFEDEDSES